jgi:hypothetical protein
MTDGSPLPGIRRAADCGQLFSLFRTSTDADRPWWAGIAEVRLSTSHNEPIIL